MAAKKQALARAVEHQHLARGIERARQRETPAEPGGGRLAEGVEALVHGIAAELVDVGGQHWANERRHAVLRLADGQADGGLAGRRIAQQLAQPHERRAADIGPGGEGGATRSAAVMNIDKSGASTRRARDALP